MSLQLFDDQAPRRVTLIKLSAEIARSLAGAGRIEVEGEVHRPKTSQGGAVFFDLRDRAAQLSVRVPGRAVARSHIVNGERVRVVGALQWSNDRGQVQLVADEVLPVGEGAIAARIERTRALLGAEGLLDRPRRPLPVLPTMVGVVCGAEAAVRHDIESVVAARCPGYPVHFLETTVSGPAAVGAIVAAIERLGAMPGVDLVILARGGGDAPSLLPWSSEEVCRAVAACPVAVVSAIGHEADRPLCDEVADRRCGTPSLAATAVLPDLAALGAAVGEALARCRAGTLVTLDRAQRRAERVDPRRALGDGLDRAAARVDRVGVQLVAYHPAGRVELAARRLAAVSWRRSAWEALGRAEGRLTAERRHLDALSPQRTLERGFAVVTGPDGRVVRAAGALRGGDRIGVRLADGEVAADVVMP